MVHRRIIATLAAGLLACGAAILQSKDIELTLGDTTIRVVDDTGAIIVGKRHVASVGSKGKIVNSRGQLVAWVRDDTIRLPGGASIPINKDTDGTLYLSESAQRDAGLEPIEYRVRPNGRLARSENVQGIETKGAHSAAARRTILAIVLLTQNDRW